MLHRAPPPKRPYFSLRVLTPTFTAYILATHWLRGGYSDHLGFLSPLPSPHILLHLSPFLCFFLPLADYTILYILSSLFSSIHPSLLLKRMLQDIEKKTTKLFCSLSISWGKAVGGGDVGVGVLMCLAEEIVFILFTHPRPSPKTACPVSFFDILTPKVSTLYS